MNSGEARRTEKTEIQHNLQPDGSVKTEEVKVIQETLPSGDIKETEILSDGSTNSVIKPK